MRIAIGCGPLDELLGGGVELGTITQFYGEAGSGKTNICLQLARNVALEGKKVIYIDTEGVSPERLRQIAGGGHKRVAKRILFFHPNSQEELDEILTRSIKLAKKAEDVGLVVVDNIVTFYRLAIGTRDESSSRSLVTNFVVRLHRLARAREIPTLVTNQVYFDPETRLMEPLGGQGIAHLAKTVLRVDRTAPGRRAVVLMKHRHRGEGKSVDVVLTDNGLEAV